MKKIFTFLIIFAVSLSIYAQIEQPEAKGIKLTFSGTSPSIDASTKAVTGITIAVKDLQDTPINNVKAELSTVSFTSFWGKGVCNGYTIIGPAPNSGYSNQANAEAMFTFKITNLANAISSFDCVKLGIEALGNTDGEAKYQANISERLFDLTVKTGISTDALTEFATKTDVQLANNSTSTTQSTTTKNYSNQSFVSSTTITASDEIYLQVYVKKTSSDGCFFGLEDIEIELSPTDFTAYNTAIANATALANTGNGVGQYKITDESYSIETLTSAISTAKDGITSESSQDDVDAKTEALNTAITTAKTALSLILPADKTYLRIQSYVTNGYLTSPAIGSTSVATTSTATDASNIWFFHQGPESGSDNPGYLLSYYSGEYINPDNGNMGYSIVTANTGARIGDNTEHFVGTYNIHIPHGGWKYLASGTSDGNVTMGNRSHESFNFASNIYAWKLEEVTSLPITLHKVGTKTSSYGTLYLPVAVDVTSGEGTEVYAVSETNETYVKLQQISGTIPAKTGVVLVNNKGATSINVTPNYDYTGEYSGKNDLIGVYTATVYNPNSGDDNYYLTAVDDEPGFYQVENYSGKYITNKAYLQGSTTPGSKGFVFAFGDDDPTGINGASAENGGGLDVNAPMYNLQGVRVPTWYKGIVVQNGQKYLLK